MGHQHSVHSPKSTNVAYPKSTNLGCPKSANLGGPKSSSQGCPKSASQSCNSSPKRGCFSQGCIPNSENCRYSPVPDQQLKDCSPKTNNQCPNSGPKSANHVYNNNDFQKETVDGSRCLATNGLSNVEDDVTNENVSKSTTDVQEKLECQLEDSFKYLNVDDTGNELNHVKEKNLDDSVSMLQNGVMTTSDIVSGTRISPPKMKRREKARPASAVETRRSHQYLGDLPARSTHRPEVLCPVSVNCGQNISDILDDAVYCMEGVPVANGFCNLNLKEVAINRDLKAVDVRENTRNGSLSEQHRLSLYCNNSQGVKGENFKSAVNNSICSGHDTDELNGKESGYTTLEDVQLLIEQAISATIGLCNQSTVETQKKIALGNLDCSLDESPLDYSMKHLKTNVDGLAANVQQDGVGLSTQHLADSFLSSVHSDEMFLSSTQSDDAFLPRNGQPNKFYSSKQSGLDFLLSKSFEGAVSTSKPSENMYISSDSPFLSSKQSENIYICSDSTCKLSPAQAPSVGKQSHGIPEESFVTDVIDLSKRNGDDIINVRADGYRSNLFDSFVEPDGLKLHGKAYASVPKPSQTSEQKNFDFMDEETEHYVQPRSRSHEKMHLPSTSSQEQENGFSDLEERNELEEGDGTHEADMDYDGAVESDDGEYLPPLPSRNYVTYVNSSAVIVNPREKKFVNGTVEVNHEQTHMSWDEIMMEAKSLGIPLNAPPSESIGRVSSISSMASSQMSLASEGRSSSPLNDPAIGYQRENEMEELSPPESTQAGWSEMVPKRDGSSRDRFRLQNLFSRKNRNHERSASPTNHGIQKRCLPPVPSSGLAPIFASSHTNRNAQMSASSIGKCARRTMSNVHLPTGDRGPRSAWGSSMSVPAQCLSFTNDTGSVSSLLSNISNGNVPASCSRSVHQGSFTGSSSASSFAMNSCPGTNSDFIKSFVQLKDCSWYWGPLGWENAEAKLADKADGSFLVRDSSDDRYILSLSFRSQGITHHTRIEHYKGTFSFYAQPKSHGAATIVEFIEKAMEHSQSGKFLYFLRPRAPGLPPAPVQLLFPVSRMRSMHSLQHICRFLIVRIVRRDLIDRLPIPPRLKEYLKQTQYYVEGDATSEHQYFNQDW